MNAQRERVLFVLSLVLQGLIVVGLVVVARAGCAPSIVVIGLAVSFVPYAAALLFSRSFPDRRRLDRIALLTALVFGLAWVLAPPILSDDLYRYLWEGRLWMEGRNPFQLPPDDPALASLRDEVWVKINNRQLATIYPPLSQLLFILAAGFGGQVWMLKLLALLTHLGSTALLARISTSPKAALGLALNPLLLSEAALNGHFDILCGAALLIAAVALAQHRFARASIAACAAVGLKVVGLVLLPLFFRRPKVLLATVLGSSLMVAPLVWSRGLVDPVSGTAQFAQRWRGNESVFAVVDFLSMHLFDQRAAPLVARLLVAAAVLTIGAVAIHRRVPPTQAARALIWAVLLLSPQVHPWYLAWLLPLELAAGASAGLVWTALILGAYFPLDRWLAEGIWEMPLGLQILEYSLLAFALFADPRRPSIRTRPPEEPIPS